MARKRGTPPLDFEKTLGLIKSGNIQTSQIGRASLWVVTGSYPRMGIGIGKILTPNVSRKIFCVLDSLEDLLKQQKQIIDDGYSRDEAPELEDVYQTLVSLTHLGPQKRLDHNTKLRISTSLSFLNLRIKRNSAPRKKIHEAISRVIKSVISDLTTRTISGKVNNALTALLDRMAQIDFIIPFIDLKRSSALREIIRQERDLWKIAYTLKTRRDSLQARNIRAALKRDLKEMRVPEVQDYRKNTQKAKRIVQLAINAIARNEPRLAENYLDHAINTLGYSPKDLSPHKIRI